MKTIKDAAFGLLLLVVLATSAFSAAYIETHHGLVDHYLSGQPYATEQTYLDTPPEYDVLDAISIYGEDAFYGRAGELEAKYDCHFPSWWIQHKTFPKTMLVYQSVPKRGFDVPSDLSIRPWSFKLKGLNVWTLCSKGD